MALVVAVVAELVFTIFLIYQKQSIVNIAFFTLVIEKEFSSFLLRFLLLIFFPVDSYFHSNLFISQHSSVL